MSTWAWRALLAGLIFALPLDAALGQLDSEQAPPGVPQRVIDFDIPAQQLASALQTFADVTQIDLFYESSRMVGRQSSPVKGSYAPDMALRQMLRGTGFTIASFSKGAITVLSQGQPPDPVELAQVKQGGIPFTPYFALLQKRLHAAFCRTEGMKTEATELLVRLWIGSAGAISYAELLSSTGSELRDKAYVTALQKIAIGTPPPASMPQPVTLLMLPRGQQEAATCAEAAANE